MASIITADSGAVSGSAGLKSSADSSGVLALATGTGTTAVTIDASQNVGVGTASPARKLHVVSTSLPQFRVDYNGTYYFDISNNGAFNITDPTSSNLYSFQRNGTEQMRIDASGRLLVGGTTGTAAGKLTVTTANAGYAAIEPTSSVSNQIATGLRLHGNINETDRYVGIFCYNGAANNVNSMTFWTSSGGSSGERMRIDNLGNVGIGTTNPSSKLHVAGSFRQTGATAPFEWTVNAGAFDYLKLNAVGYADNLITANSGGNVGIGTSSPSTKLQVNGQTRISDGTTSIDIVCASTVGYIGTQTNAPLVLRTNDTERARIDTNGYLQVGTSGGSGRVNAQTNLSNISNTNAISQMSFVATGGYGGGVSLIDGTTGYGMWCQANGADFYIRRSSTTGTFTGGVYISNAAGSWSAVSDERLKNILRPIENATEKLLTLRCIVGEYKDQVGVEHPFLIAQDVQAVFPEVVNTFGEEDHLGMSYTDMVPILVKAIQEQQALITTLTERITALENK